jgi:DNA polymerase-2
MPQGLILKPTYRVRANRPVVQLFGRLQDGPPFLVEDDRFRPYFFIRSRDAHRLAGEPDVVVSGTELRDLCGEPVARVEVPLPAAVPRLRERLEHDGFRLLEADIRFAYRYLIDHGLRAAVEIDGEGKPRKGGLVYFRNPTLAPGSARPSLVRLSIDLETTADASRILSAALVAGNGHGLAVEEVHVVSRDRIDHPCAHIHGDEARLLITLASRIRELDPDLIVGWNVVDFDLRVIADRCEQLGLSPREFWLGRVDGAMTFQQDRGFTRQSRADIPGRIVLDGLPLVRDAMRLPDYRLETVARAVLGRGKLIDHEVPDAAAEILRLYEQDPVSLVAYNLEDARLVLEILDHEGLLDLALERSLLSGMQLDRIGASIASFDLLYLPELRRRGIVAPSVDSSRKLTPVKGGAVLEAEPGHRSNVAVFDFKSLYPSLVRTFNLDPVALDRAEQAPAGDLLEAPNGARFSREPAILPTIIERFMERRERARERGDRHADQAIKIMMNAMFGVFAASSCRFFDPQVANAITGFGQQTLAWTRDAFESLGVRVLYGDTDSVFVAIDTAADTSGDAAVRPRAVARAEELRERVEQHIAERIRREYGVEPLLTLELEQVFDRFFLPRIRGGREGSKKRYAGSIEGRLEIVGLEAVRRDWPAIAGRLQRGMLTRLFSDRAVMPFVKEIADDLMGGKLDDELVYVKRIRKGSLERYTASTPPHIQAARKARGKPGPVVRYVIARTGPEPVDPGGPLPEGLDRRHYLERVVRPIADAILLEAGQSFDEAMGEPRQLDLL